MSAPDRDSGRQARSYSGFFLWVVTFAAAIAIERLTDSVTLAVIMPCAHAAWKSLSCAFWLLGSDEVRPRAWACFLFYLATACWKAAATAFATAILCMEVVERAGQRPPEEALSTLGIIVAGGGLLTGLVGVAGLAPALSGKAHVWVDPAVQDACRGQFSRIGDSLALSWRQPGSDYSSSRTVYSGGRPGNGSDDLGRRASITCPQRPAGGDNVGGARPNVAWPDSHDSRLCASFCPGHRSGTH